MRIQPLIPPYSAEVQAEVDLLPRSWQPPFQHYGLLGRDPRLLRAYRLGSVAYLDPGHITVRQREVFLLRVTGRCQNAVEWTLRVHYFADDAGLTEEQLHASVHGSADDSCWQSGDCSLIRLADELHDKATISDALWEDMQAVFPDEAILQLLLLAGHYRTNAYVSKGSRVPVESRVKRPFPVEQADL